MRALYLLLLPLLLFAACASDEVEAPAIAKDVTITLGAAGGRTTRATEDPNAFNHELIHSLDLFLVKGTTNNSTVSAAYHLTAADLGSEAAEGNLPEKSFSGLTLDAATYSIYAFANFDKCPVSGTTDYVGTRIKSVYDNFAAGTAVTKRTLDALGDLVAQDPAANINFADGAFIPMATDTTLTLADGDSHIIYMHRLVSRIDVSVVNKRHSDITLSSLTMGKFADGVVLLPDNETKVISTTTVASNTTSGVTPALVIPADATIPTAFSFYVNATENSSHGAFSLTATLDDENATYTGATTRTTLPRNSIFPLTLRFSDYEVNFDIQAQVAPIGGYPITVLNTNAITEDLLISLPEGCTFTIAPTLTRNNGVTTTTDTGATFAWSISNDHPDWFTYTLTGNTISGKVSAEAGLEFTDDQVLTLITTGSNGKTYTNRLRFRTVAIDNTTK